MDHKDNRETSSKIIAEVLDMDTLGLNLNALLAQIINLVLIAGWLIPAVISLLRLRSLDLPRNERTIWAALILLVPFLGVIAFWIVVKPGRLSRG